MTCFHSRECKPRSRSVSVKSTMRMVGDNEEYIILENNGCNLLAMPRRFLLRTLHQFGLAWLELIDLVEK